MLFIVFSLLTTHYSPLTASAEVASSTNYRIQMDSINVGGGLSTSTSYQTEDTLGESGVGTSSSAIYNIKAGYQQMQQTYVAITAPGSVTLSPEIPTSGGGTANGSASWTVTTDNAGGYTMNIRASSSPALASGANSFANYTPASSAPDFAFSVAPGSGEFGFTPEGDDIASAYKDNGSACNTGSSDAGSACWMPITTSVETIVRRTSETSSSGTATTIRFRAATGGDKVQPTGVYSATMTLTVVPL